MKNKLLIFASTAAMILFTSCAKDDTDNGGNDDGDEQPKTERIVKSSDIMGATTLYTSVVTKSSRSATKAEEGEGEDEVVGTSRLYKVDTEGNSSVVTFTDNEGVPIKTTPFFYCNFNDDLIFISFAEDKENPLKYYEYMVRKSDGALFAFPNFLNVDLTSEYKNIYANNIQHSILYRGSFLRNKEGHVYILIHSSVYKFVSTTGGDITVEKITKNRQVNRFFLDSFGNLLIQSSGALGVMTPDGKYSIVENDEIIFDSFSMESSARTIFSLEDTEPGFFFIRDRMVTDQDELEPHQRDIHTQYCRIMTDGSVKVICDIEGTRRYRYSHSYDKKFGMLESVSMITTFTEGNKAVVACGADYSDGHYENNKWISETAYLVVGFVCTTETASCYQADIPKKLGIYFNPYELYMAGDDFFFLEGHSYYKWTPENSTFENLVEIDPLYTMINFGNGELSLDKDGTAHFNAFSYYDGEYVTCSITRDGVFSSKVISTTGDAVINLVRIN